MSRKSVTEKKNLPAEISTLNHLYHPRFLIFSPKNLFSEFFRCYSAHPVSILTFTGFVKLFQVALRSRSMDLPASNTVKHTREIKTYSQAFNFQKKAEKSLVNTKMAVKFDVNRKRCS